MHRRLLYCISNHVEPTHVARNARVLSFAASLRSDLDFSYQLLRKLLISAMHCILLSVLIMHGVCLEHYTDSSNGF